MSRLLEECLLTFINLCIIALLVVKIGIFFNTQETINILDAFISCFRINFRFLYLSSHKDSEIIDGYITFSDKLIGNITLIMGG